VVAQTNSKTCPVTILERYLLRVGITLGDNKFLFRAIQKTKNGEKLCDSGHKSYRCLRSLYFNNILDLGFPAQEFGGATAAANANVPDRTFKRHERW